MWEAHRGPCCHRTCQNLLRNEFWQLKCDFAFKIGLMEPEEYISIILVFFFACSEYQMGNFLLIPVWNYCFCLLEAAVYGVCAEGPASSHKWDWALLWTWRTSGPKPSLVKTQVPYSAASGASLYLDAQLVRMRKSLLRFCEDLCLSLCWVWVVLSLPWFLF